LIGINTNLSLAHKSGAGHYTVSIFERKIVRPYFLRVKIEQESQILYQVEQYGSKWWGFLTNQAVFLRHMRFCRPPSYHLGTAPEKIPIVNFSLKFGPPSHSITKTPLFGGKKGSGANSLDKISPDVSQES
jgi:hypothetical protein